MNTPPLLLGAALLFWGWQTGYWVPGILMAAGIESARVTKTRWDFSHDEFNQLWNLSVLLFLGAAVYAFAANEGTTAITGFVNANTFTDRSRAMNQGAKVALIFVQWLPMVFFPFAAAQAYSSREKIDFRTFSLILRRQKRLAQQAGQPVKTGGGINVGYPYFGVCLAATSAINTTELWYYGGLCLLLAWALWLQRSRRFAAPLWAALVLLAAGMGFAGHRGLQELQTVVQNIQAQWLTSFGRKGFDPKESRTNLGRLGKLKLSGKIVLRVTASEANPAPALLRETSYQTFASPTWHGTTKTFTPVYAETTNETMWRLLADAKPDRSVTVAAYLSGGEGILALPTGVARLDHLAVFQMQTNHLAAMRVGLGPGLVIFQARYGSDATFDAPATTNDLAVPREETNVLAQIAEELGLAGQPLAQALKTVNRFFQQKFQYCTWLATESKATGTDTPLARFLTRTRAGHCEYFATATVLLLRQAGIPARYAAGYSVQESTGPRQFVVRQRHAHAWCLYYDEAAKVWRDFDTTPASWLAAEEKNASAWQPLSDAWSRLWFEFSKLRWGQSNLRRYVVWLLAAAIAGLAARFFLRKGWRRSQRDKQALTAAAFKSGLDSEFFLVEKKLVALGLDRRSGETLSAWLERINNNLPASAAPLRPLLRLHNRLRFDPQGLRAPERAELKAGVEQWLARAQTKESSPQ